MEVKNATVPNKEQIAGFFEPGPEGPIHMVNLLKFKERAEYEDGRETELTGARPEFFFAPAQIARRDKEWGPGTVMLRAGEASARVAVAVKGEVAIDWTRDVESLQTLWLDLLDNRISPRRGQMVSLTPNGNASPVV